MLIIFYQMNISVVSILYNSVHPVQSPTLFPWCQVLSSIIYFSRRFFSYRLSVEFFISMTIFFISRSSSSFFFKVSIFFQCLIFYSSFYTIKQFIILSWFLWNCLIMFFFFMLIVHLAWVLNMRIMLMFDLKYFHIWVMVFASFSHFRYIRKLKSIL